MIDNKYSMKVKCPHCHKDFDVSIQDFKLRCNRCNYEWLPRSDQLPEVCPNPECKSPYWNKPRVRKVKKEKK